jgi:hypothetical protein
LRFSRFLSLARFDRRASRYLAAGQHDRQRGAPLRRRGGGREREKGKEKHCARGDGQQTDDELTERERSKRKKKKKTQTFNLVSVGETRCGWWLCGWLCVVWAVVCGGVVLSDFELAQKSHRFETLTCFVQEALIDVCRAQQNLNQAS